VQVEPQVALGRGLAPAVLRPVQAGGHQADDRASTICTERRKRWPGPRPGWPRTKAGHCTPRCSSIRQNSCSARRWSRTLLAWLKVFLAGRLGPAHGGQFRAPQPQCVADIVEAERVTDLGVEHRHHVAPRLEGAGLPVGPGGPSQLGHQMWRDELAELPQHANVTAARASRFCFFHHPALGRLKASARATFTLSYGTAVHLIAF
jgi:hypothetical protein